jgi:two-component system, chemotaxis family, CheB/CheR fusion protein
LVHELATNATKYGALSQPAGTIRLGWKLVDDGREQRVRMVWQENGGPKVTEPVRAGFGSSLIDNGFPGATVDRDFRPDGLVCTIEFPLHQPKQRARPEPR